ncbi:MAG: XRE family transcriptional regulator [Muribaculaceae bacterium]|nr:XRE family transcriptional regulator [Muribaculaceae bacterium]MDE7093016.1 XRE family transcriptional regulator [Muribaculaceae bacterium]
MTKKNKDQSLETEPIFIGKIIQDELRRQERSVTWFSRKIHCDRRNVYDIFRRTSIDTDLLLLISWVLNVDLFSLYSNHLQSIDNQQITPPYLAVNYVA